MSHCNPMLVKREVTYDGYRADFLTPKYLIEVKKALPSGGTAVHHTMGQILYYSIAHRLIYGEDRLPVIMIFGSYHHKYTADLFTRVREYLGVNLWVMISLREGKFFDVDSGIYRFVSDVFSESDSSLG